MEYFHNSVSSAFSPNWYRS